MIQESRVQDQTRVGEERRIHVQEQDQGFAQYRPVGLARVTWSAVIAGTVAAIAAQVLFVTLGLAIGLSIPATQATATGMGIFAGIWWLVTGLIALFIGGWVAGRYTPIGQEIDSALHGVMTWALATTLSVLFVTTFGGMLAAGAIGAMADDIAPQIAQTQDTATTQTQATTQQPATNGANQTATAGPAWWTFFALLLGLVAAGIGGFVATPREPGSHTHTGLPHTTHSTSRPTT